MFNIYIKRFMSENWLMRLFSLVGECKIRPTGWNLRQELTLRSWSKISSSSRKPQVLFIRPLTDWTRLPQYGGWSPLLQFRGWCESYPLNTFIATSRQGFGWTTRDWPGQADTNLIITVFIKFFLLWKVLTFILFLLCFAVHFGLHWMKSVRKISEAYLLRWGVVCI